MQRRMLPRWLVSAVIFVAPATLAAQSAPVPSPTVALTPAPTVPLVMTAPSATTPVVRGMSDLPTRAPVTGRSVALREIDGEMTSLSNDLTAAHKTLPFGTQVRVRHATTGKEVLVRVNDRGPHVRGRVIDLSRAAAAAIGLVQTGVAPVVVLRN